jgi:hypothetical protein
VIANRVATSVSRATRTDVRGILDSENGRGGGWARPKHHSYREIPFDTSNRSRPKVGSPKPAHRHRHTFAS